MATFKLTQNPCVIYSSTEGKVESMEIDENPGPNDGDIEMMKVEEEDSGTSTPQHLVPSLSNGTMQSLSDSTLFTGQETEVRDHNKVKDEMVLIRKFTMGKKDG